MKYPKKYTRKIITQLEKIPTMQIYKEHHRDLRQYPTIDAKYPFQKMQGDVMLFENLKVQNKPWTRALIVIDIYSRYLFVRLMKNEQAETTKTAMKSILDVITKKFQKHVEVLTTDKGSNFESKIFSKFMKDNDTPVLGNDKNRQGIVERVIRTLRNLIKRYVSIHGPKFTSALGLQL